MVTNSSTNTATAASGTILQGQGVGTANAFSTATYPATTTSQQILYSTANNAIGQLTTANSKLPATNSSGTLAMRSLSVVVQTFTGSGTYTPTTGMLYCTIEVCGGGGGSAGCPTTGVGQVVAAGGAGGGGYSRKTVSAATIGTSQTVTIGAGGTAGSAGANPGGAGGTSSLGAIVSASGGGGSGQGAPAGPGTQAGAGAGAGGVGSSGDFNVTGNSGGQGYMQGTSILASGGSSGSSYFGGGQYNTVIGTSPVAGSLYGGGANGGAFGASTTQSAGAAGGAGIIVITEYVIN